jgi:hypothetical protein
VYPTHSSPYTAQRFDFQVKNPWPQQALVYFRADGVPEKWTHALTPAKKSLAPGELMFGRLDVRPDPDARDCTDHTIQVSAWLPRGDTMVRLGGTRVDANLRGRTTLQHEVRASSCFDRPGGLEPSSSGGQAFATAFLEHARYREQFPERRILPDVGGRVAFENNRAWMKGRAFLIRQRAHLFQIGVPFIIANPHRLERAVAFDHAGHVVVNAFARTGEQPRRGIVLVHDQVGIGLVALQRDANDHLANGRPRHRVGTAQRLRAKQHMDAEGAALSHDAIEQKRRSLRDLVVLYEEFLELVDNQE